MFKKILLSSSLLVLSACGTIINGQTQAVTVETPGAENAQCTIHNGGNKYDAYTGQTINIRRSNNELVVNCKAAGNREQTVYVKREANDWVFLNVANGFVPGAAYDFFSGGAFEYPDTISVSFVGQPITAYDAPNYAIDELNGMSGHNNGEHMGATVIGVPEDNRLSTLPMKDNVYQNNSFDQGMGEAVYTQSKQFCGSNGRTIYLKCTPISSA